MLLSRHFTAGQNHDIKMANWSLKNVSQFKYFGKILNQNLIQEEIETEFW
jgi:hypothetical protein